MNLNILSHKAQWVEFAPLLHWDEQALAAVAARVAQACLEWRREWTGAGTEPVGGAVPAPAAANTSRRQGPAPTAFPLHAPGAASGQSARAWLACLSDLGTGRIPQPAQLIGREVFGDTASTDAGTIAAELGQAAMDHLVRALRGALGIAAGADGAFDLQALALDLPQEELQDWSGGVRVELPGVGQLALYLDGRAVAAIAPARPAAPAAPTAPLTPLTVAAQGQPVEMQARLHGVEFTLGHLKSLQVGDVVVLPHALEQPLQLMTASGAVICQAYLGRTGAHRSIELVPNAAARGAA